MANIPPVDSTSQLPEAWLTDLVSLINGEIPRDEEIFHCKMEDFFLNFKKECGERCKAPRILNPKLRREMRASLWEEYKNKDVATNTLLQSDFIKKLSKHGTVSDKYLSDVEEIVRRLLVKIPNGQKLQKNTQFLATISNLAAVIFDPEKLARKNLLFDLLPAERKEEFFKTFYKLNQQITEYLKKGWLTQGVLGIIKNINRNEHLFLPDHAKIEPSRGNAATYFSYHYLQLIEVGKEDGEIYKGYILDHLTNLADMYPASSGSPSRSPTSTIA